MTRETFWMYAYAVGAASCLISSVAADNIWISILWAFGFVFLVDAHFTEKEKRNGSR